MCPQFPFILMIILFIIPIRSLDRHLYFAIAVPSTSTTYTRTFNKTLANLTQTFWNPTYNISLDSLVIDLPENGRFSSNFLEGLCVQFEGRRIAAVLIVGDSQAAFTVALVAGNSGIPILWARGNGEYMPTLTDRDMNPYEIYLQPGARETLQALRSLFVQTHWHSFTIIADDSATSSVLLRKEFTSILNSPPLHPTIAYLPHSANTHAIFRRLADVSRATRGVVILMSNINLARRVLDEAKRLNMVDGHFVWLWIDTSVHIQPPPVPQQKRNPLPPPRQVPFEILKTKFQQKKRGGSSDLQKINLIKNDKILLMSEETGSSDYYYSDSDSYYLPKSDSVVVEEEAEEGEGEGGTGVEEESELPIGLLAIKIEPLKLDRGLIKGAVRLLAVTLRNVLNKVGVDGIGEGIKRQLGTSCWRMIGENITKSKQFSAVFARELKLATRSALAGDKLIQENGVFKVDKSLVANFQIINLVPDELLNKDSLNNNYHLNLNFNVGASTEKLKWRIVGHVTGRSVHLDTIVWPGGDIVVSGVSTHARSVFRVVTALAPPFVMESELDEDGQCLRGIPCHRVLTSDKDNLTLVFNEMETHERLEDEDDYDFFPFQRYKYRTNCCYGLAMDLLENVAQELEFDFRLYISADGLFGSHIRTKTKRDLNFKYRDGGETQRESSPKGDFKWNGIVGDLVSGAAHMSFAALSVSSLRSEVIDFSAPFFFSGVSFLAAPQQTTDIPLLAFLLPFSTELWIAIFTSLNITAVAVAVYEWLSPFGLNPWGRQRSKNFSMSSALWVMWGLLCGHLVAFKAPKSWPNKFLINVWGGFSVIFVASYTANIAALIAGLFFHNAVSDYHDRSLLSQRVGAPVSSAAESYVQRANHHLWSHISKYKLSNVEEGVRKLRNGTLDILIADTPILDYYRATDHGCKLQKIGDTINEDAYAVGMTKGFPLKDSISAVIAKYASNGYIDILQEKWYGGLPCFKLATDMAQPRPLGVAAVTGVFILLGLGVIVGLLILFIEHWFYRYALPRLRHKPKGTIWRSRNIMFFSQKLYRFINCVELVSPHHAARELVHTIRQGQITSLFQKSVKRKEHEQRRRRKSKAQFFEMIQEIRRVQQEERDLTTLDTVCEVREVEDEEPISPRIREPLKSPKRLFVKQIFSPRTKLRTTSATLPTSTSSLNNRRFSIDSIGRRLSRDPSLSPSSRRSSYLPPENPIELVRKLSDVETIGRKLATLSVDNDLIRRKSDTVISNTREAPITTVAPITKSDRNLNEEEERIQELRSRLRSPNPRIEIEDMSKPKRCQSLSEKEIRKKKEIKSYSLDARFQDLPPAPPPPNCSPRNGKSPLERLSKDDLVLLWRSSESELRSHLLKALREKQVDDPP